MRKSGRPAPRRLVQLYAALLYNAHVRGFIEGKIYTGPAKALCVPGLNCYSCPGAVGACPLGALQNALAGAGHGTGWYVLGMLLLFGITLGRTVCGWLCPMGLLQELLNKLPTPKIRKSRVTRALSWLKYAVLAVMAVAVPLVYGLMHGKPLPAFCKYICPAGTLEGAVGLLSNPANGGLFAQLGALFTNKFVILVLIVLACVFLHRAFCRFLCPLGALYGLFNRFALTGMRVNPGRCTGCGACVRRCPMDVRTVGDRECIACGRCVAVCPEGAITLGCGRLTLQGPALPGVDAAPEVKKPAAGKRAFWLRLAPWVLLAAVLVWVNWPAPAGSQPAGPGAAVETETWESSAPLGHEVGQQLPDFSLTLADGSDFHLAQTRGSIVMINQWATYCGPCVAELPYFEAMVQAHPGLTVLAVHHWLEATPKMADYIRQQGWEGWQVRFALDRQEGSVVELMGGDNVMPRTLVLNRRGEVVFNEQRPMTPEMLEELIRLAEGDGAP